MIYCCKPKRKNLKAAAVSAVFFVIFLSGIFLFPVFQTYRHLLEFIAAIAAAIAFTVAGRYLFREYLYALSENGDQVDFTVVEIQGKRRRTVCRISLSDIREIADETYKNREEIKEKCRPMKNYDYCMDLGAHEAFRIFLVEDEKEMSIRLSPDENLKAHLTALLKQRES